MDFFHSVFTQLFLNRMLQYQLQNLQNLASDKSGGRGNDGSNMAVFNVICGRGSKEIKLHNK